MSDEATQGRSDGGRRTITADEIVCERGDFTGSGLREVQLIPWGEVQSKRGTFILDDQAASDIVAAFADHGTRLVIDWEHQTLGGEYASPTGKAPAAGWIHTLWAVAGVGLKGLVEWTDVAREEIRTRQYLYLSPVVAVRTNDKRAVELHSAALTNKPAIPRMERLAAKDGNYGKETKPMAEEPVGVDPGRYLARIAEVLQVGDDAPDDAALFQAILEAVRKLKGKSEGGEEGAEEAVASKAVLEALKLKEDADQEAVLLAIHSLTDRATAQPDAVAMKNELEQLKADRAKERAEKLVASAVKENKLNPNNDKLMALATKRATEDPEGFTEWMACQEPYVPPGKTQPPPGGAGAGGTKSREQIIANAAKEYDVGEGAGVTDLVAWVNGELRDLGKTPLTEKERSEVLAA